MFEARSVLPYKFVQADRNKGGTESYLLNYIFTFWVRKGTSAFKYVVWVKNYPGNLTTVDFYAKIDNKEKFMLLTNQNKFGVIGATLLAILKHVREEYGFNTLGFIAASLIGDATNMESKRYKVYKEILKRKLDPENNKIYLYPSSSLIFVMPNDRIDEKDEIIKELTTIIKETS